MNPTILITAALIMLSRAYASGKAALPVFRGVIEPIHLLPGRMRLSIPSLIGNPDATRMLKDKMERLASVIAVESSTVTGSLCLRYDPRSVAPLVLYGSVIRLLDLEPAFGKEKEALLWKELRAAGFGLSESIYHMSHGLLDLKTLVGIGLIGIVIRDLLIPTRRLNLPGTFTIGWWAYKHLFSEAGR